jgi:hypothetical protein
LSASDINPAFARSRFLLQKLDVTSTKRCSKAFEEHNQQTSAGVPTNILGNNNRTCQCYWGDDYMDHHYRKQRIQGNNCETHPPLDNFDRKSKINLAKEDLEDHIYETLIFQHHCRHCEGDLFIELRGEDSLL